MTNTPSSDPQALEAAQRLMHQLGSELSIDQIERDLPRLLASLADVERVILLLTEMDSDPPALYVAGTFPTASETERAQFKTLRLLLHNRDRDPVLRAWGAGQPFQINDRTTGTALDPILDIYAFRQALSIPLYWAGELVGALISVNHANDRPCTPEHCALLVRLAETAALIVHNAIEHTNIVHNLADMMYELRIMRQIDRELNESIGPEHVYSMTLDWALRFANANYAALALYDKATDKLDYVAYLGYDRSLQELQKHPSSIALRVARSGQAEIVPDVSLDPTCAPLMPTARAHLSVPLLREDRVIAVISVECKKTGVLNEAHREFIEKLGQRASVAIDNARLYERSEIERQKLSAILSAIGDVVIVVSPEQRLMLINQSAVAALHLDPRRDYVGTDFFEVFEGTALEQPYRRILTLQQALSEQVTLPNGKTYSANLVMKDPIGCIIVLHDITHLKETDQLKTELISTVSHDLKQPLAVMRGYIELLQMRYNLEPQANQYLEHTLRSLNNMQALIDDLLDMARLERGIDLRIEPVDLRILLTHCIDMLQPLIRSKALTVRLDLEQHVPPVAGDQQRLSQVFNNVIGNAIKYTPPNGRIAIGITPRENAVTVSIADTGIGISPEDQGKIFDRFYRVRRAETEQIDGTGVGLSIVKRLVEAHQGQIGLESTVGQGTTFYISLPIAQDQPQSPPHSL
jgi:signal transduction histidine kinase